MKTTLAPWTARQVLLHNRDFFDAELPINIEMQTGSRLNAICTLHKTFLLPSQAFLLLGLLNNYLLILTYYTGAFIPNADTIYLIVLSQGKLEIATRYLAI
jgi:hypothetical protein